MASEKLADGIRLFTKDIEKLEVMIREKNCKESKNWEDPRRKRKNLRRKASIKIMKEN